MSECPRCGAMFSCSMVDETSNAPCWCTQLALLSKEVLEKNLGNQVATCFCQSCLQSIVLSVSR